MLLIDNTSTDDLTGDWFDVPQRGGRGLWHNLFSVYVWATSFGGGTVTIEVTPMGDSSQVFTARRVDETQALFTQSDVETVRLRGFRVRARISGSTGVSGLSAKMI